MAKHSGQTVEKIKSDTERDNFLTARDALDYGLIDRIVQTRDEEVNVATSGTSTGIKIDKSDDDASGPSD